MNEPKSYVFVIEPADDGFLRAYLPDLPGCTTSAESPELAEVQLKEAVDLYLSDYRDRGLATPSPLARVGTVTAA